MTEQGHMHMEPSSKKGVLISFITGLLPLQDEDMLQQISGLLLGRGPLAKLTDTPAAAPKQRKSSPRNRDGMASRVLDYMKDSPDGADPATIVRDLKDAGRIKVSATEKDIVTVLRKNPRLYRINDATGLWRYLRLRLA